MGCVPPEPGFLEGLRQLCDRHDIVLIVDEVMTGFRVAYGGAQQLYGVRGDLVCLGKILGGGLPVGAFGGRRDIMQRLAPEGDIYQAGTLSGNPLAMSAGLATLKLLREEGVYQQLEERSAYLAEGLRQVAADSGVTTCLQRVGSMFCSYFQKGPVTSFAAARASDTEAFAAFFGHMLQHGVHLAPSQFEAGFVSLAHTRKQLDRTIEAARLSLRALASVR
jgi:glutamate-1-semialdehyde 2,1-aminomutase